MKVRAHVIFSGKVQGVFFRSNTERQAVDLGVKGWVKNLPDKTVEAIFEGEENIVLQLIEWCSKRQPYAKVTDTKVNWESYTGEFNNFKIEYF